MNRKFPQLDAPEIHALDALWEFLERDEKIQTYFHTLEKWDGTNANVLEDGREGTAAKLPMLRIDPAENVQETLSFKGKTKNTHTYDILVWSPGWNVRDLLGLMRLVRNRLTSATREQGADVYDQSLKEAGICRIRVNQAGLPQQIPDSDDRYMRGMVNATVEMLAAAPTD